MGIADGKLKINLGIKELIYESQLAKTVLSFYVLKMKADILKFFGYSVLRLYANPNCRQLRRPFSHIIFYVQHRELSAHKRMQFSIKLVIYHPLLQAVMFYGSSLELHDLPLPRNPEHRWGIIHEESPKNNWGFCNDKFMRLFNYTATFQRTSDFPLTLIWLTSIEVG